MSEPTSTRRSTSRLLLAAAGGVAAVGVVFLVLGVLALLDASDTQADADDVADQAAAIAADAEAASAEADEVQAAADDVSAVGDDLAAQTLDLPARSADVTDAFNALNECGGDATTQAAFQSCFEQHAPALSAAVEEESSAVQRLRDALASAQQAIDAQDAPAPEVEA